MSDSLRVLALQPYDGGSHRATLEGWIAHSRHTWTVLTLPPRHWKWRMRHGPIEFAARSEQLDKQGGRFDAIFTTDMLNVAEFRGLALQRIARLPTTVYFHENQYAYPVQPGQRLDLHLAFSNLVSMIAAEQVWFNSDFNRRSMREHVRQQEDAWPDFAPVEQIANAFGKSVVQYPGIEIPERLNADQQNPPDDARRSPVSASNPVHLVWAARWEHDKGPEELLLRLNQLVSARIDFKISVIGQSFRRVPEAFDEIKRIHQERILHWGYQESRDAYWQVLSQADIFLSTARHEFFGISAAEAIIAGCIPLLPNRLAYPELLGIESHPDRSRYLYEPDGSDFCDKLRHIETSDSLAAEFQQRFSWQIRAPQLDDALQQTSLRDSTE